MGGPPKISQFYGVLFYFFQKLSIFKFCLICYSLPTVIEGKEVLYALKSYVYDCKSGDKVQCQIEQSVAATNFGFLANVAPLFAFVTSVGRIWNFVHINCMLNGIYNFHNFKFMLQRSAFSLLPIYGFSPSFWEIHFSPKISYIFST